jgi:hypothetical protein
MSSTGYKLLGFTVWHGARWYLRRRVAPRRALATRVLIAAAVLGGAGMVARRAGH